MYKAIENCLVCEAANLQLVLSLGDIPSVNHFVQLQDAPADPRFPLELMRCGNCAHYQISLSVDPSYLFADYSYVSGTTDALIQHAEVLLGINRKQFSHDKQRRLLEIGSNDGSLLSLLAPHCSEVLGVDPAENLAELANEKGVPTVCSFFGKQAAATLLEQHEKFDLIIARHVFAHVPSPLELLQAMATCLSANGVIEIEAPHLMSMFENNAFDTIYHEHICYFSAHAISHLAQKVGLKLVHVEEVSMHGGSMLICLALESAKWQKSEQAKEFLQREIDSQILEEQSAEVFSKSATTSLQQSKKFFEESFLQGKKFWGYGASAKAQVLMNALELGSDNIELLFDRSPYKAGRYTAGTRIPVVHPDSFDRYSESKDVVIFPWNLSDEIVGQLKPRLQTGTKLFTLIPEPKTVAHV